MNEAIWHFRLFERACLAYLVPDVGTLESDEVGLWDKVVNLGTQRPSDAQRDLSAARSSKGSPPGLKP